MFYNIHGITPAAETWRRVWGGRKNFRAPEWHFSRKKFPFCGKKFRTTFFSHRPGFQILRFFTLLNLVYDPFFTRKTTISKKNSLIRPFSLLCLYFRAHPTTLLL